MNQGVEWAAHCAALLAALPRTWPCRPRSSRSSTTCRRRTSRRRPAAGRRRHRAVDLRPSWRLLPRAAGAGHHASRHRRGGRRRRPGFRCTEIRRRGPSAVARRCYTAQCGIAGAMAQAEQATGILARGNDREDRRGRTPRLAAAGAREGRPLARRNAQTLTGVGALNQSRSGADLRRKSPGPHPPGVVPRGSWSAMPVQVDVLSDRHEITCVTCRARVDLSEGHTCPSGRDVPRPRDARSDR